MSILKNNVSAHRIAILAAKNEKVFHIKDLANLWRMENKRTLRITLKRYCDGGLLYRIYRGFYSLIPLIELDPVLMGAKAIHQFCYLSTETVLFAEGYISQNIEPITFVSAKSLKFTIGNCRYVSRQLHDRYLYNPEGVMTKNTIKKAGALRAIADMLYFNPRYHFDRPIDLERVKALQKAIGYPLTPDRYDASKTK